MTADETSRAQLMLAMAASAGASERLAAVLAVVSAASVIITPSSDEALVAALVSEGQRRGAAMLIAEDPHLARSVGADGVHLGYSETPRERYETARALLGGKSVVGCDAGRSKHDAMTLGELGADFVAFGVPEFVKDRQTAFHRQLELLAWWSEIFEVPSVALDAADSQQARAMAAAGADFVCLRYNPGTVIGDMIADTRSWAEAIAAPAIGRG
ncbi:MAG: thiamine phosphate synthase [Hyphomicrobiaceae bacterium]